MSAPLPNAPPRTPQDSPVPGLEDDAEGSRVVAEELRLLATVQQALAAAERAGSEALQGRVYDDARLLELREDVSTAKPEDLPALLEQMHHLGALRAQRGKGVTGTIDPASPYFGHLRLAEDGKRRDILVGGKSYVDTGSGVRIVDWRHAPVSRIFYRYGEGDDYEESLGGKIVEGEVLARRSVSIVKGQLLRVSAPQGLFSRGADGIWKRLAAHAAKLVTERKWGARPSAAPAIASSGPRLGVGADGELREDKHLPAIASMLDPAQFELITKPGAGLVAIQGSAGSGKTTVGLHRVGYLAFTDPRRFQPDRMMVVVPNEALVHYVQRVLPTLGVEGVPVTTFASWSARVLSTSLPKLPTRHHEETPTAVTRAKSHPRMLRAMEAAAEAVHASLEERIRTGMARWEKGDLVLTAFQKTRGPEGNVAPPDLRITALASWVAGKRTIDGVPAASTLPQVTQGALERLGHELRQESRAVVGAWDELLTNRARLGQVFEGEGSLGPGQLDQVHAWCVRQSRIRQDGERDGELPSLDSEDPALLLRLWQLLRGPLMDGDNKPMRLAHLFADEVQDASPVELRVLLDLTGADRSVTLAGDVAQRMFEVDGAGDHHEFAWSDLLRDLGMPLTTIEPLKVSYRSTAEITTFARRVLGPLAHDAEPIADRNGPAVELFNFASPGEAVAFLAEALRKLGQDEPYANIALIARFAQQADVYFEGLRTAEVLNVRRVSQLDFTWAPGVDITDVRQTKGLEFDEVVLLETTATSYPVTSLARHTLYVGATRAAHQLWCVASEAASPLVEAALENPAAG